MPSLLQSSFPLSSYRLGSRACRFILERYFRCKHASADENVPDENSPRARTVAPPEFVPCVVVIGFEVRGCIQIGKVLWVGGATAGMNILDEDGPRAGSIALPKFEARKLPSSAFEKRACIDIDKYVRVSARSARSDVPNEYRSRASAIAFPQLRASYSINGLEIQHSIDVSQTTWASTARSWRMSLTNIVPSLCRRSSRVHYRCCCYRLEVERPIDIGEREGKAFAPRGDILDEYRSRACTVTLPEFRSCVDVHCWK